MRVEARPAKTAGSAGGGNGGDRTFPPAEPAHRRSRRAAAREWRTKADVKFSPYAYIAPFFVLFAVFGLFPLGYTFWVSLHDWELVGGREFSGLENYRLILVDASFWNAVYNTIGIFVIATVPQLLIALLLANALNRRMRGSLVYRMGVLAPLITSTLAVAIVFTQLYGRDFGMVNWLLGQVGIDAIDWQAHKWSSWIAIATMVDWRWTGYNALIYLAAMQAIPVDLYEAAEIDGASRWRQFWQLTVPMLRPTIIFTVIISTIGGLQLFVEPLLFGSGQFYGGSLGQFQTVTLYMFENAFRRNDYGYGATVAWMLFLLIVLFSVLNFLIVRRISSTK
jgi:cellobiose transport system permease protein